MKVNGYDVPDNLLYNKEHAWVLVKDNRIKVGITDYAQKMLKEITYLYLPKKGMSVKNLDVI
ncbi:MAG: glycine cleavage system protein H, partial [Candidatus Bathyarchaeota archaeon]